MVLFSNTDCAKCLNQNTPALDVAWSRSAWSAFGRRPSLRRSGQGRSRAVLLCGGREGAVGRVGGAGTEETTMEKALQELLGAMGSTEAALLPFFEAGGQDAIAEIRERHGPKAAAEVQLALAYAVNALFFTYLKTQGIDPQTHPVKEELARVQGYMKKLKTAAKDTEAKADMLRVNKDAASRFIAAGLGTGGRSAEGNGTAALSAASGKRKGGSEEKTQPKQSKKKKSAK